MVAKSPLGLAPMSTPLGELFMFTVDGPHLSLSERRYLLDWVVRPALRTVPGVADVNALGGMVKTYSVTPDADAMVTLGVSTDDLLRAIGIPLNMYTVMFAIGRMPGWIANWRELLEHNQRISRPRQIYTGETTRPFVPLAQR